MKKIKEKLKGIPSQTLCEWLGISPSSLSRKLNDKQPWKPLELKTLVAKLEGKWTQEPVDEPGLYLVVNPVVEGVEFRISECKKGEIVEEYEWRMRNPIDLSDFYQ